MTDQIQLTSPEPPEGTEVIEFRTQGRSEEEDLDMTPMVDITFLLLIFFMVTAAFSLQKSIEVPPPDQEESARQTESIEDFDEDDYVIVRIDRDNTIWVNDSEAAIWVNDEPPSVQELLVRLREACEGVPGTTSRGPSSLLVLADGDCRHEAVIMALDAGNAVGMEDVRLATVDETDF